LADCCAFKAQLRSLQAAEKLFFEGVILSAAKDLLFVRVESEADPSVAQNRRGLRMTLQRVVQQPASSKPRSNGFNLKE
jgi:hypothetical protein